MRGRQQSRSGCRAPKAGKLLTPPSLFPVKGNSPGGGSCGHRAGLASRMDKAGESEAVLPHYSAVILSSFSHQAARVSFVASRALPELLLLRDHCCCCSVAQSCPTVCDPVDCSARGFPVLYHLLEFAQTHAHCVGDAIQ